LTFKVTIVALTNTNAVEEQRPSIADNPAILGDTPGSGKHDQTEEHDGSILDKTPTTTNPNEPIRTDAGRKEKYKLFSQRKKAHTSHPEFRPRSDPQ
jgi:hypothetical protein